MNSEQLQEYLSELRNAVLRDTKKQVDEIDASRRLLSREAGNTRLLIAYITNNYTDVDHVQPIVAQLLALYYKGGVLRYFALQFVPALVSTYLLALSKKQHKSTSIFETFFLAVYNEEILAGTPNNGVIAKKVEEIRIPSIRFPSIYHDPTKINSTPEVTQLKLGSSSPTVQNVVRIGPFPTVERFTAETKFMILTRLLKSVNGGLCYLSSDVVCRSVCLAALSICSSGFSFPESKFRSQVLDDEESKEAIDDFSRKPRIAVSSHLLLELLIGVHWALFNGTPDLALRAIDSVHQRSQYELFADVLLVTNSMRNQLLENPLSKEKREEFLHERLKEPKKRKDLVTNASLKMRKMPEDIPVLLDKDEHKDLHSIAEGVHHEMKAGVDHMKKKLSALKMDGHQKLEKLSRKMRGGDEDGLELNELQTIEEKGKEEKEEEERRKEDKEEKEEKTTGENGSFRVPGLRHMDSNGSTHRSVD